MYIWALMQVCLVYFKSSWIYGNWSGAWINRKTPYLISKSSYSMRNRVTNYTIMIFHHVHASLYNHTIKWTVFINQVSWLILSYSDRFIAVESKEKWSVITRVSLLNDWVSISLITGKKNAVFHMSQEKVNIWFVLIY